MTDSKERLGPLVEAVNGLRFSLERRHDDRAPLDRGYTERLSEGAQVLALLRRVPGLREQFTAQVPPSRMRRAGVRCACGQLVDFSDGEALVPCPGDCGRTFLRLRSRVLVGQFEAPEPDGPCECSNRRVPYEGRDGSVRCSHCDGQVAERVAA